MVDQADFVPGLTNPPFQDNANEAIHRFITLMSPLTTSITLTALSTSNHPLAELRHRNQRPSLLLTVFGGEDALGGRIHEYKAAA